MISVVIPLYNKAPHIRRALDSVLHQSMQDFECVVVDDGSTDGSGDRVQEMLDPRIRLMRQANAGASLARNKGIELARYPLIAFLDADDEWLPDFLAANVEMHRRHPEIAASFTNYRRQPEGKAVFHCAKPGARVLRDYFAFCLSHHGCGMWTSAVMARRETLLQIGGFPPGRALGEDLDTWARLAWSGPVAFIPEVHAIYHCDAGSSREHVPHVDVLPTYQSWRDARRVPATLAASSAGYAYFYRFYEIYAGISARQGTGARALLSEVPWPRRFSLMGCSARLALLFPRTRRYACGLGFRLGCFFLAWKWEGRAG